MGSGTRLQGRVNGFGIGLREHRENVGVPSMDGLPVFLLAGMGSC